MSRWMRHWKEILFFSVILGVYLFGTSPDMSHVSMAGDQFWWVPCSQNFWSAPLGGYPTYIILGWLFERLPFNLFFNLALLSTLSAVGTCIFVYLIVRYLTTSKWAPYIGSATCAGAFIFWTQAIVPEIYALTILLSVAMTYFVFAKHYYVAAVLGAVGLGTHHLIGFVIIPLLVYIYRRNRSQRQIGILIGIGSLGLLAYLQTYLSYGDWSTPAGANLRGLGFVGGLPIGMTWDKIQDFVPVLVVSLGTGLGLLPFIRRRPEAVLIGVISLLTAGHYFFSNVAGWTPYLALTVAFVAILVGLGVEHFPYRRVVPLFLIVPMVMVGMNFQTYDIGRTVDPEPTVLREVYTQVVEYEQLAGDGSDTLLVATLDVECMGDYYLRFNEQTFNYLPIGYIWMEGEGQDDLRSNLLEGGILMPEDLAPYGENTGSWDYWSFLWDMHELNPTLDIYFGYSKGIGDDKESFIELAYSR